MVRMNFVAQHDEEIGSEGNVQWASAKAREDQIYVVVLAELGWLSVGIYDRFNRIDSPKLLMRYLYKAIYNELEGLFRDNATSENAHVMRYSHPSNVNKADRQDIKVIEGEEESKAATVSSLTEISDCARADSIVSSSNILIVVEGESEFSTKLVVICPIETNQQKRRKLWGLVVCHHFSSRFVPCSLRYVCKFLIQRFGFHMNKEVELAAQMRDIARWLLESDGDSNGLSTNSLMEAGYPHATVLGDVVCGVAAVKITSTDLLFRFLTPTSKEIKWGGAKHDFVEKDDGRKMHPQSSFKAFLEVVKRRSLPWKDVEIDAIHSLLLISRGSLQDDVADDSNMIVNSPAHESILYQISKVLKVGLLEKQNDGISFVDIDANEAGGWRKV